MLPDPFTITASAPTPELVFGLVASSSGNNKYGSERRNADGTYLLTINHTGDVKKGETHYMQLKQVKDAVNPYTGGTSKQVSYASITLNVAPFGWDAAAKAALVKALIDTLNDTEVTAARWINFHS